MSTATTQRRHRLWRRLPARGLLILAIPVERLRRVANRVALASIVAVYVVNFVVLDAFQRAPFNSYWNSAGLRRFPFTVWSLYADLSPDELRYPRVRLELPEGWDGPDFDRFVYEYPEFMHGGFHSRIGSWLSRGKRNQTRATLQFLVNRYWAARKARLIGLGRPPSVHVRLLSQRVSGGRHFRDTELDRTFVVPIE